MSSESLVKEELISTKNLSKTNAFKNHANSKPFSDSKSSLNDQHNPLKNHIWANQH